MAEKKGGTTIRCTQCGTENALLAVTCKNCGASLVEGKSSPTLGDIPVPVIKPAKAVRKKGKIEKPEEEVKKPEEAIPEKKVEDTAATISDLFEQNPPPAQPPPATIVCGRCGQVNDASKLVCDICQVPLASATAQPLYPATKEHPFGSSLGVGCLSLGIGYVIEQVIVLILGLVGLTSLGTTFTVCACILLLACEGVAINIGNNTIKERGYRGFNVGGLILAIVISVIFIFIIGAILSSAFNLYNLY
jgi:hypothetical protein